VAGARRGRLELGVYVPNCHHGAGLDVFTAGKPYPPGMANNPQAFVAIAREAERLGFDALWVGDHIAFPPHTVRPHRYAQHLDGADLRSDQPIFDPLVVLTFLAGQTSRIKLAVSVLVVPYRNPVLAAKWIANLDVLSGGRVLLGVGTGWMPEEFAAVAAPFAERGAVTLEYLEVMRAIWTQEKPSFSGRFYQLDPGLRFYPKPLQQPLPVWGGGSTPRGLRRAAKIADGWIHSYFSFDEFVEKKARLTACLEAEGRDPARFIFGHHARLFFYDEPYPDAPPCVGSAAKIADDIKRFRELGVQHLELAPPPGPTTQVVLDQLYRLADEVLVRVG
jgi:probable F420-dependent oxidoreductase